MTLPTAKARGFLLRRELPVTEVLDSRNEVRCLGEVSFRQKLIEEQVLRPLTKKTSGDELNDISDWEYLRLDLRLLNF